APGFRSRLERRLLLPMPWFDVRPGRTSVYRRAGTYQSQSATPLLCKRHCHSDRTRCGEFLMAGSESKTETKGLMGWIDARLPVTQAFEKHMSKYYAPKNFNFWYVFGVLSMVVLVNQLLTGIWLTMNFTSSAEGAFASVEYIMRDVDYGWILRYMHSTGASA